MSAVGARRRERCAATWASPSRIAIGTVRTGAGILVDDYPGNPRVDDTRPGKHPRGQGGSAFDSGAGPPRARRRASVREDGDYELPSLTLLDTPPLEHAKIDEEALKRSASLLEQKLADFGVEGKVVEVQPGPVVTMYKFEPASG